MELQLRQQYQSLDLPDDEVQLFVFPTHEGAKHYKISFTENEALIIDELREIKNFLKVNHVEVLATIRSQLSTDEALAQHKITDFRGDQVWYAIDMAASTIVNMSTIVETKSLCLHLVGGLSYFRIVSVIINAVHQKHTLPTNKLQSSLERALTVIDREKL